MKKIRYFLIAFFLLISVNTVVNVLVREKQKMDFVKVEQVDIDTEEINFVKKRVHNIIAKIENGEYDNFSNQNVEKDVVEKIDITHQKDIQKQIKTKFGSYINLHFDSLFKSKTGNPIRNKIYLFKGEFESKKNVEIRVILNNKKEIIGLNVMSWEKEYFNYL